MTRRYAMHKTGHRDGNQNAIEAGLKKLKIPFVDITKVKAAGDLLVGYNNTTYQFEIKDPSQPGNKGDRVRLSDEQKKFRETWSGHYAIVKTLDDVLDVLGLGKGWTE